MTMDLPGVHPHRLRRDAEAHVLEKRGMLLRITIRGFRPPHYRPRREGSCRKGKEKHRILSTDGRSVRKDAADAPIRGEVSEPADQDDRMSRSRGIVAFTEEAGSRDRDDRRKVERDKNAMRECGQVRELILKRN